MKLPFPLTPLPNVAEINNMAYLGTSAFAAGITAADYENVVFRDYGETIRVWSGYKVPVGESGPNGEVRHRSGRVFVEQFLDSDAKAWIYRGAQSNAQSQPGIMPQGSVNIATQRHQITLSRGDRVLLVEEHRLQVTRCILPAGKSQLPELWARDVLRVLADSRDVIGWRLDNDVDGNSTLSGLPNVPCTVVYRFAPLYVWRDSENRFPPKGSDGLPLPQVGELIQEFATVPL